MPRSGGRSANIWKNQETLTKAHDETTDKDSLLRQIRSKIALKAMRKAHVEASSTDRKSESLNKMETEKEKAIAKLPYSELSMFQIREVEEIAKDAKINCNLRNKGKRGKKRESKNLGKPQPIFKELIKDIKKEHVTNRRINKSRNRRDTLNTLATDFTEITEVVDDLDTIDGLPKETELIVNNNNMVRLRPLSANNAIINIENRVLISKRPHSASVVTFESPLLVDTTTTATTTNENYSTKTRNNTKVTFYENFESGKDKYHDDFKFPDDEELVKMIDKMVLENPQLNKKSSMFCRRTSSMMRGSIVENDEKIQEALRKKDVKEKEKVDNILQRIENKQIMSDERERNRQYLIMQKAWMIIITVLSRISVYKAKFDIFKANYLIWCLQNKSKKAILFIERWWKKKIVWLKLKRNPAKALLLKRIINSYRIRLRVWRKHHSAEMIKNFLNDCTGLSEFMAKIYRFRSRIIKIQKWIKAWFEIQNNRVRVLYIYAERLTKATIKEERINKMKEDKWSIKAMEDVQGFSDVVGGIKNVQMRLNKLLVEHQHNQVDREREREFYEEKRNKLKSLSNSKMTPLSIITMLNTKHRRSRKTLEIGKKEPKITDIWLNKRRSNKIQWETVTKLRYLLAKERRKHIIQLEDIGRQELLQTGPKINEKILKEFIKGTQGDKTQQIENSLNYSILRESLELSKPVEKRYGNFLLYTKGGFERINSLIAEDSRSFLF